MALTPAEKMQRYRERLKAKGGKTFSITLSLDEVSIIETIGRQNYPDFEFVEVVRAILNAASSRAVKMAQTQIELKERFELDATMASALVNDYIQSEKARARPLSADEFMREYIVDGKIDQLLESHSESLEAN